jgi:hypothetical protein
MKVGEVITSYIPTLTAIINQSFTEGFNEGYKAGIEAAKIAASKTVVERVETVCLVR